MKDLLHLYDDNELNYLIEVLNEKILECDERGQLLRDFKDEITTYLSNKEVQ